MDEALVRKRCEVIRLLWRSLSKQSRAANVREAIYRAAYADGLEAAAKIAETAIPKAHTYASENADRYRGQDDAAMIITKQIRQHAKEMGHE